MFYPPGQYPDTAGQDLERLPVDNSLATNG